MSVDYNNDLLLITCASGKQASHLVPLLVGKWKRLRLQCKSDSSAKRLQEQYPSAEVVKADMFDHADAAKLLFGVTTIYFVGPSFHAHETQIGYTMVDAALDESKKGNFQHFVFSSVIQTQLRKLLNHDCKRYVEEYLMESGLNFTILQPTTFLNNLPVPMLLQQENPVHQGPFNPRTEFSFVALEDLGAVSAKVFEEREKHYFAQYPLVSTTPMPYARLVEDASKIIGKNIKIEETSPVAVEFILQRITGSSDPAPGVKDTIERLLLYYNRRGLVGNPLILETILGRKATGHVDWLKLQVEKAKSREQKP